jgi:hypothetical protein
LALPFKLLVFVLDKPILADPLIRDCMFDLVVLLLQQSQLDEKLLLIANNLFRMLELDLIWGQLAGQLSRITGDDSQGAHLILNAVSFAIMHLSVCEESSLMIHLHLIINIVLDRMFASFSSFPPKVASEMLELCLLLLAKLPISMETARQPIITTEKSNIPDLCRHLIDGKALPQDILSDTVNQAVACNALLVTEHSSLLLVIDDDISVHIGILSKSSAILSLLLQRLKPDLAGLLTLKYALWVEALATAVKEQANVCIIEAILKQLSDHSGYWKLESSSTVRGALIECLLPKLWGFIIHEGREMSSIAPLISRVAHVFPKEADIFFATIISDALRRQQCEALECFALLWNFCMNSNLLLSVPLRLSLTVMTESLCGKGSGLKSRKCTFTWMFVLCQHLSVLLDPILAGLADVIECGFSSNHGHSPCHSHNNSHSHSNSNSNSHNTVNPIIPKAFDRTFDADEVVYYLDLLHSLLEINYDGVMNFLQGHEVSPALLNQWMAFEDSLRLVLQIELKGVERRSYYNLFLALMVPLLLLDVAEGSEQQVKASALQLMSQLGHSASRDSTVILNVLIALSIDNLSVAVSRDVEKQVILIGFFLDLFRGNDFVAGLFDREDIVALGELGRKALWGVVDIEVVQAWTDFILAVAFLPRSDVELITTVMSDSVYLRLTGDFEGISEALLTSLLACMAKLTVFYYASKVLPASSASALKKSVSGLLADRVQDVIAAAPFDVRSGPLMMNTGALERALFAFLEAQHWLKAKHLNENVEKTSWSQCLIMLTDTCRQFYLMNPGFFTPLLITLLMKHQGADKVLDYGAS